MEHGRRICGMLHQGGEGCEFWCQKFSTLMRLLLLTTAYPTEANIYQCAFLRPRVRGYLAAGHEVTVLNFRTATDYRFDGADIVTESTIARRPWHYDVLTSHAPNLRCHLRFLYQNQKRLPPLCLTFHGHEVVHFSRSYPPAFPFRRGRFHTLRSLAQSLYDHLKIALVSSTLQRLRRRGHPLSLCFVSQALRQEACSNLGLGDQWGDEVFVVHNPLGERFLQARHQCREPLADFVTIRPTDPSEHAIDLVAQCARQNPDHTFHVYGRGRYFEVHTPPPNLTWHDRFVANDQIPDLLNRYRGALMPARRDTHGVMMCEMAVTGMPLLASDLPVHREVLAGFGNVEFLDNQHPSFKASEFLQARRGEPYAQRFSAENTVGQEIEMLEALANQSFQT